MANYKKCFFDAWKELEQHYKKKQINPQQENDITCYLYHALLKRGFSPNKIWTENTYENIGLVDMNIDNRLLVEIRLLSRKNTYGNKGWKTLSTKIYKLVNKLKRCFTKTKRCHIRHPVIALWNWRGAISEDLHNRLEKLRKHLSKRGLWLLYGPKRND